MLSFSGFCVILRNMKDDLQKRKPIRLKTFDYNTVGAYFITICTQSKKCILSEIVGDGVLDIPKIILSKYGQIVNNRIIEMNSIYDDITVDKYIVMPNHLHMIIVVKNVNGMSRTPSPTNKAVPFFISTLKRLTNKESNTKLWQRSYYDHIIRNDEDYLNIWQYIESNPSKWQQDKYFNGEKQ